MNKESRQVKIPQWILWAITFFILATWLILPIVTGGVVASGGETPEQSGTMQPEWARLQAQSEFLRDRPLEEVERAWGAPSQILPVVREGSRTTGEIRVYNVLGGTVSVRFFQGRAVEFTL